MADKYSMPDPASEAATDKPAAETEGQTVKVGGLEITLTTSYIQTPNGIATIVSIVLAIIILITLSASGTVGCDFLYGSSYSFMYFTASSWLTICIIRFVIYILGLEKRIRFFALLFMGFNLAEMVLGLFHGFFYFIASIVVAVRSCHQDGYKAAAAFGFFAFFALLVDIFFMWRRLKLEHPPTENKFLILLGVPKATPQSQPPEYSPDANVTNTVTASPTY